MKLPLARLPMRGAIAALLLMCGAVALAFLATPRMQAVVGEVPKLESTVPLAFGDWKAARDAYVQVDVSQGVETAQEQPYDQTVMRTYVNGRGDQVMLALAWGERQRQDIKVHRPEVCYPAQGFAVRQMHSGEPILTNLSTAPIPTVQLLTESRSGGFEAVRYWIRIGTQYGGDGLATRWYILKEGISGRIPDGILVRASVRLGTAAPEAQLQAQQLMQEFLRTMVMAAPPDTQALFVR